MKRINFITVTLSLIGLAGAAKIFQGDCSDEKSLCEQLCIKSSSVTYQCKCWSGHNLLDDGFSCKADTKTQYEHPNERTINVQVLDEDKEKLKPIRFTGSNYARFPITEDTYLETNITLQFRIEQDQDGVILFAGQLLGDDFLAITREGPNIILRHDCGEGTIEDMYHAKDLIPGPWHEINVWRKNCNRVEMKLDQGHRLVDDANEFMNFKGITIDEGVFLGGAPRHIEFLREKTGTTHGFTGCVRKLIINGHVLLDTKDGINKAMDQSDFEYCSDHVARAPPPIHDVTLIKAFDLTREGFPEITDSESERKWRSLP